MKMKEVIEKTGLTDRAVRLYIDEGLAVPNIEESYSGRKSIDFSESDVERLKNVALLRKAGFSIADIKSMVDDNSTAKNIIEKFIEQTENNIAHETEIVDKLKGISFDEEVTFETICETLMETVEGRRVPKADIKLSSPERILRTVFCSLGIWGAVLSLGGMTVYIIYLKMSFVHTTYSTVLLPTLIYLGWILAFALSVILLKFNSRKYLISAKKSVRHFTSAVIPFIIVLLLVFSSVFSYLALLGGAHSETANPNKYLNVDTWIEEEYIEKILTVFPEKIPDSAEENSVKYFYRHTYILDPDFDIAAEWILPAEEYEKAKSEITGKENHSVKIGDWNCLYVINQDYYDGKRFFNLFKKNWTDDSYFIVFAAFNDKENAVRYIASYAIDSYTDGPYYLSLEW